MNLGRLNWTKLNTVPNQLLKITMIIVFTEFRGSTTLHSKPFSTIYCSPQLGKERINHFLLFMYLLKVIIL